MATHSKGLSLDAWYAAHQVSYWGAPLYLPLKGGALLLVRKAGWDISASWEEQEPEPEVELS